MVNVDSALARDARELRLAVVFYGGVSLAIYEYGVAKELYKLVRAARAFEAARDGGEPLDADAAFRLISTEDEPVLDSERAYYTALQRLAGEGRPLTVVLDVISGTSAGGINGVCLARGLAEGLSLDGFRTLWLDEGDINKLLNGHHVELFGHPATKLSIAAALFHTAMHHHEGVLNGDLMCQLLRDALSKMDPVSASLVRADESLDLYTTTTSVFGYETAIPTGLGTISHTDRSYRQLMHFHHETPGATGTGRGACQFRAEDVPALAFAARATSGFPGAFPPVSLGTFANAVGGGVDTARIAAHFEFGLEYGATHDTQWYMDGGVLDNGPFDHAIHAIARKRADIETARELIYIEPDPGAPPAGEGGHPAEQPDVRQTVWSATMSIPQHAGFLATLHELRQMNTDIADVGAIAKAQMGPVQEALDAATARTQGPAASDFTAVAQYDATLDQAKVLRADAADLAGRLAFPTYCRLRAQAVANSIASVLAGELGYPPQSNRSAFISTVLGTWARSRKEWTSNDPDRLDAALSPIDIPYRIRRASFVLQGINEQLSGATGARRGQLLTMKRAAWDLLGNLRDTARAVAAAPAVRAAADEIFGSAFPKPDLADPSTYVNPADFVEHGPAGAGARLDALFGSYVDELEKQPIQGSSKELWEVFHRETVGWDEESRRALLARYLGFPIWDALIFPIIALAKLPQLSPISVTRFSPLDAHALEAVDHGGDPREVGTSKLDGVALGHFGGFFDRAARENDYLWGRLDAAELIMRMLARQAQSGGAAPVDLTPDLRGAFDEILRTEASSLDDLGAAIASLQRQVPKAVL